MKNLIKIAHRMDDYVCMWNGAEEVLPPKFFFMLIVIYAGGYLVIGSVSMLFSSRLNARKQQ